MFPSRSRSASSIATGSPVRSIGFGKDNLPFSNLLNPITFSLTLKTPISGLLSRSMSATDIFVMSERAGNLRGSANPSCFICL